MDERRLNAINTAAEALGELNEAIEKSENLLEKAQLKLLKATLEAELQEAFSDLLEEIIKGHPEEAELLKQSILENPQKIMELYHSFLQSIVNPAKTGEEIAIDGLPSDIKHEIIEGLKNTQETGVAYQESQPLLKALVKRGQTAKQEETQLKVLQKNDMVLKKGGLSQKGSEILSCLIKCRRDGIQTLRNGQCYATDGQIYKWISGGKTSLSPKMKKSIREELEVLRHENIVYMTDANLSDVLGLSVPEEIRFDNSYTGDEIILPYNAYSGKIRGQKSVIYVYNFAPVLERMLDKLPWYEPIPLEAKNVKYVNEEGKLETWKITEGRLDLRISIFNFVFSYLRARTATEKSPARPYSNKKPYRDIFAECNVTSSHPQTIKRKKEDIAAVLDHLKREGFITDWKEYSNRGSKVADGIQIFISEELLKIGE